MQKRKAAVLAATGAAGQQFIEALYGHPWFEITGLYASTRSEGKTYAEAAKWFSSNPMPPEIARMKVGDVEKALNDVDQYDVFFSALPSEVSKEMEGKFGAHKPLISTASGFRYENDVPILVPEVNAEHAPLIRVQQQARGWKGFVVPGPNCTTMGLIISLKPIYDRFGIKRVFMTSMQALSGAGYPGNPALDIVDNMIPFIAKEEGKVQLETVKTLGKFGDNAVANAGFPVSCTCTRIAVIDGHMLSIFVETDKPCSPDDYRAAIREYNEACRKAFGDLPSAPAETIIVKEEENRPQPRLDRDLGGGMSTVVGRIRQDEVFGAHGLKYVALSHNTKRGAAKGEVLAAEYLIREGYF
ncbi:MAG TPA: aspartate-semialdehyde dehydrogenase [bacterium]|nr:aspartate-semialdehyde dehydrogenase [bacterium]